MRFFRDSRVSSVLKSSCVSYTLRFSAIAPCIALPPASMQSCARCFLALPKKSLFLEAPYYINKVNPDFRYIANRQSLHLARCESFYYFETLPCCFRFCFSSFSHNFIFFSNCVALCSRLCLTPLSRSIPSLTRRNSCWSWCISCSRERRSFSRFVSRLRNSLSSWSSVLMIMLC